MSLCPTQTLISIGLSLFARSMVEILQKSRFCFCAVWFNPKSARPSGFWRYFRHTTGANILIQVIGVIVGFIRMQSFQRAIDEAYDHHNESTQPL